MSVFRFYLMYLEEIIENKMIGDTLLLIIPTFIPLVPKIYTGILTLCNPSAYFLGKS